MKPDNEHSSGAGGSNGRNGGRSARPWSHCDRLQADAYDHGFELAVSSGAWEKTEGHVHTLSDYARSAARRAHAEPFDPARQTHDRLVDEQYQSRQQRLRELEDIERHAVIQVRDATGAAACAHAQRGPKPQIARALIIAAISVFAVTVAPTLHDFIWVWLFWNHGPEGV